MKTLLELAEPVQAFLFDHGIPAEVEEWDNELVVSITWGDWKHSHLYTQELIRQHFPQLKFENEEVTEEDGSDCYSADHHYSLKDRADEERPDGEDKAEGGAGHAERPAGDGIPEKVREFADENFALDEKFCPSSVSDGEFAVTDIWYDHSGRWCLDDAAAVKEWGLEVVIPFYSMALRNIVLKTEMINSDGGIDLYYGQLGNGTYFATDIGSKEIDLFDEPFDPLDCDGCMSYEWQAERGLCCFSWGDAGVILMKGVLAGDWRLYEGEVNEICLGRQEGYASHGIWPDDPEKVRQVLAAIKESTKGYWTEGLSDEDAVAKMGLDGVAMLYEKAFLSGEWEKVLPKRG